MDLITQKMLNCSSTEKLFSQIYCYKNEAKSFYFEVILSSHECPDCQQKLKMVGISEAKCVSCGQRLDPTLEFQESPCCRNRLIKKYTHYACSLCNKTVTSKFLFDEKIFDKRYFKEMMKLSRDRAKKRKEELKRLILQSRSGILDLSEAPVLENIPGLVENLDDFILFFKGSNSEYLVDPKSSFQMTDYKNHILGILGWGKQLFSSISSLHENKRKDRVWRFITLIFMQQAGEVALTQQKNDLWVQKVYNEAYY